MKKQVIFLWVSMIAEDTQVCQIQKSGPMLPLRNRDNHLSDI